VNLLVVHYGSDQCTEDGTYCKTKLPVQKTSNYVSTLFCFPATSALATAGEPMALAEVKERSQLSGKKWDKGRQGDPCA